MSKDSNSGNTIEIDREEANFHYDVNYKHDAGMGLSEDTLDYISNVKGEDQWITDYIRITSLSVLWDYGLF